jgi:hypothetical protein
MNKITLVKILIALIFTLGFLLAPLPRQNGNLNPPEEPGLQNDYQTEDQNPIEEENLPEPEEMSDSFKIRGVIEGFYGEPWTMDERKNMFGFMRQHHFNTYVYAPKDDPYQRLQWGDLYPESQLAQMKF